MTDRPELDAWLDEADAVLDQDGYGVRWEASAMTARFDEHGEPVDPTQLVSGWRDLVTFPPPTPREGFRYFPPTTASALSAYEQLGRAMAQAWTEIMAALRPLLEALDGVREETQGGTPRARLPIRQTAAVRFCPSHGEQLHAGQCRLCHRDLIRRQGRSSARSGRSGRRTLRLLPGSQPG